VMAAAFQLQLLSLDYASCVQRTVRGEVHLTNSQPVAFTGNYLVEVSEEVSGEVIDQYRGALSLPAYSTARQFVLKPVPLRPGCPVRFKRPCLIRRAGPGIRRFIDFLPRHRSQCVLCWSVPGKTRLPFLSHETA